MNWGVGMVIMGNERKTPCTMKTLTQLHDDGVINYLVRTGVVSATMLAYLQYHTEFSKLRHDGRTYRDAVRQLSQEHRVSMTTIKKGIRIVTAAERIPQPPSLRIAG